MDFASRALDAFAAWTGASAVRHDRRRSADAGKRGGRSRGALLVVPHSATSSSPAPSCAPTCGAADRAGPQPQRRAFTIAWSPASATASGTGHCKSSTSARTWRLRCATALPEANGWRSPAIGCPSFHGARVRGSIPGRRRPLSPGAVAARIASRMPRLSVLLPRGAGAGSPA
jgi:hypothetical protein